MEVVLVILKEVVLPIGIIILALIAFNRLNMVVKYEQIREDNVSMIFEIRKLKNDISDAVDELRIAEAKLSHMVNENKKHFPEYDWDAIKREVGVRDEKQ